jgi:SAM-dependent methyltransferase
MFFLRNFLLKILAKYFQSRRSELFRLVSQSTPRLNRECVLCGYKGKFEFFGAPGSFLRNEVRCPSCNSFERHRLFWLYFTRKKVFDESLQPVLHFAPEKTLENKLRIFFKNYQTADFFAPDVDLRLNIEKLDLESESIGSVFCFHVLEHVDDKKALSELRRVIKKGGFLFIMVPLVEGWESTYENPEIINPQLRMFHFGQNDHVRYYGRDFRDRIKAAGFKEIEEFTAFGEDVVKFSLLRGEKLFICS